MAQTATSAFEFEFRDYLTILRRRKFTVLVAVLVVMGSALFLSVRQDKIYRATAVVLMGSADDKTVPDLDTEQRVLQSAEVRQLARQKLPTVGSVTGAPGGSKRILAISAESPSPRLAADSVNVYIEAFGEYRQTKAEERLQESTKLTQGRIDALQTEIDALTVQLEERRKEVDAQFLPVAGETTTQSLRRQADATRAKLAVEEQLKPRLNSLLSQQISLEQLRRDQVATSQRAAERPTVITPPSVPTEPVKPQPVRDGILAGAAGLILGIALALLFDYLDDSINTPDDVRRALGDDVSVVGLVPNWADWRDAKRGELVSLAAPKSPVAEAYRAIRTSISFVGVDRPISSLSITSPQAGEGKTTTLANLAVVLAGVGRTVVLVDCDLRRPRLHTFFGLSNAVGFTSVLIGEQPISAALQRVPGVERLSLLASGPVPPNPSELLSSTRLTGILRQLQSDGAFVLVDSPPLLPVTDASLIATAMDATLLVAAAGRSTRKNLRQAVENLRRAHAPLIGVVLNRVSSSDSAYYYYYYDEAKGGGQRRSSTRREPDFAGAVNYGNGWGDGNGNGNGHSRGGRTRRERQPN
jgi:succinoglycan biosynthesis transport protein ExoP